MFPKKEIKYKGNTTRKGEVRWDEYIDESGISTLEIHTPKVVWKACKNHYFIAVDKQRNVQCRKCGFGQKLVLGLHKLIKGKIVKLHFLPQ